MDIANAKYFDYLDEYGEELQTRLHIPELKDDITFWRKNGTENPKGAGDCCRNISERMIKSYIGSSQITSSMKPIDRIRYVKEQGLISDSYADKFHEIRKIGNKSSHESINFHYAEKSMKLLDEILRKYVYEHIDEKVIPSIAIQDDSVFVVRSDNDLENLDKKAKLAADLSNDSSVEAEAKKAGAKVKEQNTKIDDVASDMNNIFEQIDQVKEKHGLEDSDEQVEEAYDRCDSLFEDAAVEVQKSNSEIERVENKIDEILSEHDYIEKLLRNTGKATDAQMGVLAFPKGSKSSTNILQVAGSAGTGKTLCLLAKIIKEIEDDIAASAQTSMFERRSKRALFVCFNKDLAEYVREILDNYPRAKSYVDVVNIDFYINQLVKPNPPSEYKNYANDVRYPSGYKIYYSKDTAESYMGQAMKTVGARHPNQANAYYLDYTDTVNVGWMNDEARWLEARYENINEARNLYPKARRVGRGTQRLPNENVRRIILEVWDTYRNLLEKNHLYTIEQAVKRLMISKSLPKYDLIAIDEVQDFSVSSIKLLLQFRVSEKSRIYISGDEDQKIYQRDFTWKELDSSLKGYTITLRENKRNSPSIRKFADRLRGKNSSFEESSEGISVLRGSENDVLKLASELSEHQNETTVLVGSPQLWGPKALHARLSPRNLQTNSYGKTYQQVCGITKPGLYIMSEFKNKGLEFDNVIVADMQDDTEDAETDKRLRYVHFTRARKRLCIFYSGKTPKLLQEYYSDFLSA